MIQTVPDLRTAVNNKVKVIPNNEVDKTQAADVKEILLNILDTMDDLVARQGFSISNSISTKETAIYNRMDSDVTTVTGLIDTKINAAKPDLTPYLLIANAFTGNYNNLTNKPNLTQFRLNTDAISYNSLTDKPTIPTTPDLSIYQKISDSIAFSRLTGVPTSFSGSYLDLTNKSTIFDGNYNNLSNKPVLFDGSYTSLTAKPTLFNGDYTTLTNKPTIITDYTQLANKPSMSKLLWNQTVPVSITNTTSEVNSLVTGNGTLSIEANPIVNTAYRLTGRGLFSLQTLTSPTLVVKVYLGTTLIATGTSSSLLLGASNKSFSFGTDILITATNQVYAQGFFAYYAGATDALSSTPLVNSSGGSLNTTIDLSVINQLKMTFTWSVASTANIIMVKVANLEKLNN